MQNLFRGYVPTRDKSCLMPYKNKDSKDLMGKSEVDSLSEYAGIIADDVILIDVDDMQQSDMLLSIVQGLGVKTRVYETRRGKHFFFRNKKEGEYIVDKCGTHKRLACGIVADIKVGCKNSYSILKYNGRQREIIYDCDECDQLPKWLEPVPSKINFIGMKSGDGRNQSLFNYILTLQSNDFSVDEARQTLTIINNYILPDPLEESELETLMRDDAFQKPAFFKRSQFLFDKFARYLASNNHIIKICGRLHIYKDGVYVNGEKEIESQMIKHIENLSRSKRAEVLSYVDIMIDHDEEMAPANYIAFRNGVYNLMTDEMEPFSPDIIITNKIPFDYNKKAYSKACDNALDKLCCHDKSVRMLLEECVGYCFYRRNELRKAIILTGDRENGKSTFLAMLEKLLGRENIAGLDLKELSDRFKTAQLFGKLANIGDDIGDEFIPNPAIFKKLSSGNTVNAEFKGKDPFDFASYAKLIFSANDIPRIKDKSGAVLSRLVIVPFNARFSPDDPDYDPYIKYKLTAQDSMEYLACIGIRGLKRILANCKFTESSRVEDAIKEYEINNNPVLLFFQEEPRVVDEVTSKVYRDYCGFCAANNYQPMSNVEFSKQVKKHFGVKVVTKRVGGKSKRIFVEDDHGS